jgi:hypothetical protein
MVKSTGPMTHEKSIDFEAIIARTDLCALIADDIGPPARAGRWVCPFHPDAESPNLSVERSGRRWKCFKCGKAGSALDWLMEREDITVVEAARRLGGIEGPVPGRRQGRAKGRSAGRQYDPASKAADVAPGRQDVPRAWQDPAWQEAVERIIADAEEMLWNPAGRPALDWLRWRGLADYTIRRFRLGFIPADGWSPSFVWADGRPRGIYRPRGVTIPWLAPGECYDPTRPAKGPRWVGCNVRRLATDPRDRLPDDSSKCLALSGSSRGYLYPWPEILPTQGAVPALILEGEFDALIGLQEAGHVVHAATVGGSGQTPHRSALVALARCPWWLLALDHDAGGVEDARRWKARAPHKARRLVLPHGKDLTEFVQSGGDVLAWLGAFGPPPASPPPSDPPPADDVVIHKAEVLDVMPLPSGELYVRPDLADDPRMKMVAGLYEQTADAIRAERASKPPPADDGTVFKAEIVDSMFFPDGSVYVAPDLADDPDVQRSAKLHAETWARAVARRARGGGNP